MNGQEALRELIERLEARARQSLCTNDEQNRRFIRTGLHAAADEARMLMRELDEENLNRRWTSMPMQ